MKKTMLSVLLVFVMLIGMVPTCVFASSRLTSDDYGSFIDGNQLINDIIETSGMNAHPRIIMSEEKFAALRAQEGKDTVTGILLEELRGEADNILKSRKNEPITYELDSEGHLLETSKKVQRGVATLALAYNIFGKVEYAEQAYADLEAACGFSDWMPEHFLDTAEMCTAFAYGYDWLYHWLSPEQRELLRTNMIEKGLKQVMVDYTIDETKFSRTYYWYLANEGDNWQFVCTGGTNLAALAIGDEGDARETAASVLTYGFKRAYSCVRIGYGRSDGTYKEGLGYWDYATYYLGLQSSALKSAAGTDYGLADYEGIARSADFVRYMSSNTPTAFNFGDDRVDRNTGWAVFLWLGEQLHSPELSAIRLRYIPEDPDFNYLDVLWIDESKQTGEEINKETDWGFVGASNASFRTTWDKSGLVAALHSGENDYHYHGHFDLGSFYIEANEKRFFTDVGNEPIYNLKDRKFSYRIKAEGHNTLVINPTDGIDQADNITCPITGYGSGNEAYAITDLTEAYAPSGANKVVRGLKMIKDKECVIIQDEISLNAPGEIYWFAHSKGQIEVASDGRSAIVTVGSERLFVKLLSEDGQFTVMKAEPLPTSMNVPGASANNDFRKLSVHLTNTKDTTISVAFIPLQNGENTPSWTPSVTSIAEWSSEDETVDMGLGARLCGCTLSLSGDIGMNYYMDLSSADLSEDAYVEFTVPSGDKTETQKVYVQEKAGEDRNIAKTVSKGNKTYYVFKCQVAAKDFASMIDVLLVDGGKTGKKHSYSVKQYAEHILSHTSDKAEYKKAEPLVKALVCYCTWAQCYFDIDDTLIDPSYKNYDVIDSVTAQELKAAAPATSVALDQIPEVTYEGATLSLNSETTLSLYFTSSEDLTFSCDHSNKLEIAKVNDYQVVRIRGILASDLDEVFEMKVICGENEGMVRYCALNYIANCVSRNHEDETLPNLVKALYLYHKEAEAYI
ncbi:MAG: heparinase II/III family protein [Clostridiales bacterium]|nr:heparinase II/III family protein [Clostridiales bacterium]